MLQVLSLKNLDVKNKKVLVRVDFNVPLNSGKGISDDTRIRAAIPTIRSLLSHGASIILMSHLGRPEGKRDDAYSLEPCAKCLSMLLQKEVQFAHDCIGEEVKKQVKNLTPGSILLLENLRFHPEETNPKEDSLFTAQLAKLGDCYVNDAFGTAHRKHASTYELPKLFPQYAAAGCLLEKEITFLGNTVKNPEHPFVAIIGGSKISSKIGIVKELLKKVDSILIGGAMSYTFLKAQGYQIGDSLCEDEMIPLAKEILTLAEENSVNIVLPVDHAVVEKIEADAKIEYTTTVEGIPDGFRGVDLGTDTVSAFRAILKQAKTIIWNGPLGIFEIKRFAKETYAIAHTLATLHATTIIGGGDSAAAIHKIGLADTVTHLSTGGGASLKYLEFGTLPALEVLTKIS